MEHTITLPLTAPVLATLAICVLAAAGFVVGAMIWLRRLRQRLASAVGEALGRQIQHGQKVEEALQGLHKHHRQVEAQIQALAQAQARARADINALAQRMEQQRDAGHDSAAGASRILH